MFEPPYYRSEAFTCPHCSAYSAMSWHGLFADGSRYSNMDIAVCHRCKEFGVWKRISENDWSMIFPDSFLAPLPNEDLPDSCKDAYLEAREIADKSPRGAAALLRLCIQSLCMELGGGGKNINDDIALLVRNGLPVKIQQALDVVRVIGNNAVHPGEIDINEKKENVIALFSLINMIVENQITQPKHVEEIFGELPAGALAAVERRDGNGQE
jgi:hypothetical protein